MHILGYYWKLGLVNERYDRRGIPTAVFLAPPPLIMGWRSPGPGSGAALLDENGRRPMCQAAEGDVFSGEMSVGRRRVRWYGESHYGELLNPVKDVVFFALAIFWFFPVRA